MWERATKSSITEVTEAPTNAASPAASTGGGGSATSGARLCGYKLDDATSNKDKKFISSMDVRLRAAKRTIGPVLEADNLDGILDEDFVKSIRALCGCDSKVTNGGFTFTKAAVDDMLEQLRGFQHVGESVHGFPSEANGFGRSHHR